MEGRPATISKFGRLDYLDSLRGIAALLVVLHHSYQTAPFWPAIVRFGPARVLLNGRSSVIFFFVLSGFVLAHGLWRGDQSTRFGAFVLRRLARIYIPYVVAALGAVVAMIASGPTMLTDTAITFNEMWSAPFSWPTALAHLSLTGTREAISINPPSWSLVYELRLSLLLPLLCFCAMTSARILAFLHRGDLRRRRCRHGADGDGPHPYFAAGLVPNILLTAHFAADFIIGVLLAKAALARAAWLFGMSLGRKITVGLAAIVLGLVFNDATASIGSALVMVLALNSPTIQRGLRQPFLLWVGRLSFSLYLTHMIVLQLVVRALHGIVPLRISILIALVSMVPVTILFHKWIEAPSARLSKRIGGRHGRGWVRRPATVASGT